MRRLGAWVLAAGLLVASCGGGDDDTDAAVPDDGTSTTNAPGEADTGTGDTGGDAGEATLRVVAINQLHGVFCPEETDFCGAPQRLELLFAEIEAAECPPVVGLAEIGPRQQELVPERLPTLCGGQYTLLWDPEGQAEPFDQEMILTSLDVIEESYIELSGFPWSAHWAKLDSPLGVVDFVVVHQASSANNPPCAPETCAPVCPAGEETGTCHSRELIAFLDERATPGGIQIVSGDLNKRPQDPRITVYYDAGFVDAWVEAGMPECDPETGEGCTCCIGSEAEPWDGGGLRDATQRRSSRIDYVLVRDTGECTLRYGAQIFAGDPAASPVDGILWPSDHTGVLADLTCT